MEETVVMIIGAGPSGLATAACLNRLSIPNIILEKEECCGSLWKNRSYDRLKLHLGKQFCSLPHMPHPPSAPTFIPKMDFIRYLDDYAEHFSIAPVYETEVVWAMYDESICSWIVKAENIKSGSIQVYYATFLVVASGENSEGFIPSLPGMDTFIGEQLHSSSYKSGIPYAGSSVLVVGSGNSGMEIAYDLAIHGAKTSITIRSPIHVMSKEIIYLGMFLLNYIPVKYVDALMVLLNKLKYGDLGKHGITQPSTGPFVMKAMTGRSAVIDVGTVKMIKTGKIKVVKEPMAIFGDEVIFVDGSSHRFDTIVFATGYRSLANTWLKDPNNMLNDEGLPMKGFPHHWKGRNGLYCVGLARRGLLGVSMDAQSVADDINKIYKGALQTLEVKTSLPI